MLVTIITIIWTYKAYARINNMYSSFSTTLIGVSRFPDIHFALSGSPLRYDTHSAGACILALVNTWK